MLKWIAIDKSNDASLGGPKRQRGPTDRRPARLIFLSGRLAIVFLIATRPSSDCPVIDRLDKAAAASEAAGMRGMGFEPMDPCGSGS